MRFYGAYYSGASCMERDRRDFILTEHAINYLSEAPAVNYQIITPIYLPVLGQVKAGIAECDDLRVYIPGDTDLMNRDIYENTNTIPIPDLKSNRVAFVLEVAGSSMEHERIYHGDYVIIQPYKPIKCRNSEN